MKHTLLLSALISITSLVTSLASFSAYSVPLVDVGVMVGQWSPDISGDAGVNDQTATLAELGLEEETHNFVTVVFKHPLPLIPNAKISMSDIETNGRGTLARTFEFDDFVFQANENVVSSFDLSHTDFTLFYSPLNNWVQIDFGLTGRKFDAEATVTGNVSGTETAVFDDWVPLLYLGGRFELPLTGLFVDARMNALSYEGNGITDLTTSIGYALDLPAVDLVAELGYRTFNLELDEDENDVGVDIELDGIFFSVGLQF